MKKILLTLAALSFLASCGARTQSGVSAGLITSWNDTIPGSINNSVEIRKEGKSCTVNVFGLYAGGDSSIEAAKRSGDITKIAFVDTTYFNLLSLFQIGCTVVRGE